MACMNDKLSVINLFVLIGANKMKAIITVVGKDRVGIIAKVCNKLAELNINVLDISQTMESNFTMVMAVDILDASAPFQTFYDELHKLGDEMGMVIHINREEIFDAMHSI